MHRKLLIIFSSALLLTLALVAVLGIRSLWAGPTADSVEADSVDRDYSDELPRIDPIEPEDALATLNVAAGFRAELVAAEPLVTDPVAIAFDANGRIFVAEMRGYSEDSDKNLGRIRVLEDTDGDGRCDTSRILVDGLSWPTAITCYDGGVFVGAAPDILYFKDTTGDGKADVRKVVFTGFGRNNVQGLLNTFKWGMDNRIHGTTSTSRAAVVPGKDHPAAGSDAVSDKPLILHGRDFAIEPRSLSIQPTSGGGQHGISFNAWGEKFVCANSNHIQFILFEDHYLARNPYLATPSTRAMIAADGPQADVFRTSPVEPWRIVRTRLRVKGLVPGPVEGGGTAAGYFTGSTGVTIYRGDAWPRKYDGWAIIGDVGSNLVHRKRLQRNGVSYIAHRVDEKSEFVSSIDTWFRPVQFANAPDGSIYIVDMYREVIEHPDSLHPVIKKHLDLTSGRNRGRIYRIVPDGFERRRASGLGQADTPRLVSTLAHPNGWHRETAARLLYERRDRRAIPPLEALSHEASGAPGRIRALWALDGLEALSPEILLPRLDDRSPRVREHAVRLAGRVAHDSPAVREKLFGLVQDDDLRVRYQLAFTLGELNDPRRYQTLAQILRRDGSDRHVHVAVRSSLVTGSGAVLAELMQDRAFCHSEGSLELIGELAAQIGKQQRPDDVADLIHGLASLSPDEEKVSTAVIVGLALAPGSPLHERIDGVTGGRAKELIDAIVKKAADQAINGQAPQTKRIAAVYELQLGDFTEHRDLFAQLLEATQPAEIQSAALETLAKFDHPEVADLLLERWTGLSPRLRNTASDVLFSKSLWLAQLLDRIQRGSIQVADLDPGRWKLLASHPDENLRAQAESLFEGAAFSGRAEVLSEYGRALEIDGDVSRGKAAFKKVCAACHKLEAIGHEIGPNLAAMRNRGAEAILVNVIDPQREVNPQYLNYLVITNDGRQLSGMIGSETATSVNLVRAENKTDTVLRIDIDQMRSTGLSLMPEGVEKEIDVQTMADLIKYLQTVE